MRFGETPNNQLNIFNDSAKENKTPETPKTKEQIADEVVAAIIADCEKAKLKKTDSPLMVTSLKEIEKIVKNGGQIRRPVAIDEEMEKRRIEYWQKVYSSTSPERQTKVYRVGEKKKQKPKDVVDVKKAQYVD